jgi:topoisomerase-4 subunit A
VDATALSYRGDDGFFAACASRTNQAVLLLDSQGRAFNLAVKDLPSARGQGEPLTGHLTLDSSAKMTHLLAIKSHAHLMLYTLDGVGFLAPTEAVITRQKAGKQLIHLDGESPLADPFWLESLQDYLVLVSSEGRMLIYPLDELPVLSKGKGNKLMSMRAGERIIFCTIFKKGMTYKLFAGKRHLSLAPADWQAYVASRAKRGLALPKGFTQIQACEAVGENLAERPEDSLGVTGDLFD